MLVGVGAEQIHETSTELLAERRHSVKSADAVGRIAKATDRKSILLFLVGGINPAAERFGPNDTFRKAVSAPL